MSEDLDVEALLEAPFSSNSNPSLSTAGKEEERSVAKEQTSDGKDKEKERSKDKSRRDDDDKHKSRRSHDKDDDRRSSRRRRSSRSRSRSRSRSPRRRRSPGRHSSRRDKERDKRDSAYERQKEREREREKRRKEEEKLSAADREAIEAERDTRTVFAQNLPTKATEDDIIEFFEKVGKVRDVRLIADRNSRRSKGFGYIEFYEKESVQAALSLTGTQWMGWTISVQVTQSEKNRLAAAAHAPSAGPTRLYVGSLHFDITEDDLKQIFAPFGDIEFIDLHKEPDGRSKGFAFVQFRRPDEAKKALTKINGLTLAGRQIKVGLVNEKVESSAPTFHSSSSISSSLGELDDEGGGIALKPQERALLMAKLQRSGGDVPGLPLPTLPVLPTSLPLPTPAVVVQPSTCILLKNMFDPATETDPNFHLDIKEDVKEECEKFGPVKHIAVDKNSQGFVFVKFTMLTSASNAVQSLNKRWFAGKMISAEFIPETVYHMRFPEAK